MLICMDLDAGGAKRKQAFRVFAEIEDQLLRMECTVLWFI
jgi:hypothetical protein